MHVNELSIDPAGEWSTTQAQRVLAIINPEAKAHGVFFSAVDITSHSMPHRRVILVAYCLEHEIAIGRDEACKECVRLVKV